jgi:hypothetical protein
MADNTVLNPGSGGDTIASDDIAGVKYQRVKPAWGVDGSAVDVSAAAPLPVGVLEDTDVYRLVITPQAVGASKTFFDLFNASGSGKTMRVKSVFAYPAVDAAVTGTLGVRLHLTRTSTVGTGGTTIATDDTSLTGTSISKLDPALAALPAQVTARLAPTGGATPGAHLGVRQVFTEETNAGTAIAAALGAEFIRSEGSDLIVPQDSGIRIVQGTVASVGQIAFEINFRLI